MWVKLQEDPPYLLLSRQVNNYYEVYVTDYITIWYVYYNENDFLERLLGSNIGLEVHQKELTQKGRNFLKNPTNLRRLDIEKGVSSLDISMTKLFEYPLQLKLKLAEGSKEMFFQNVTNMLVKTVTDLQASEQELRNLLKKKDDEIEEYKCEGKEIALRYLKTKQFNDEEHMKQHEVHKECADLVNIPQRVLDKVAFSTTRNESMYRVCADAILCLKQIVRQYNNRRIPIHACFLDVKKNKKHVSYEKLWSRMKLRHTVPDEIVVAFDYFYKNQINTSARNKLFNPFLYSLIDHLSKYKIGCYFNYDNFNNKRCINHVSFGDNLLLLGPSLNAILGLLTECDNFSKRHRFRFSVNTSKYLVFQCPRGRKVNSLVPVFLYGVPLPRVTHFNYLGYRLSEYMSDSDDFSDMDSDDFSDSED